MRHIRRLVIDGFDTWRDGHMTLCSYSFPAAKARENLVTVDGRSGAIDCTDGADGQPCYDTRTLKATLETSHGDVSAREAVLAAFVDKVHGRRCKIVLPGDEGRHAEGRVTVSVNFNRLSYAAISLEATCDPWIYTDVPQRMTLPLLSQSDNLMDPDSAELVKSTADSSIFTMMSLGVRAYPRLTMRGAPQTYCVYRLTLEPNTEYFIAARNIDGRGWWRVTRTQDGDTLQAPIVRTGADGLLYLWTYSLSREAVVFVDWILVPAARAKVLRNGRMTATPSISAPFYCNIAIGAQVQGLNATNRGWEDVFLPPGDTPVLAWYTGETTETVTIQWVRGDLQ